MNHDEVMGAAAELVVAFGAHDRDAYFSCFAPSATFVFYNFDRVLTDRADYEAVWTSWEAEGFQVLGCQSLDQAVTMVDRDVAVFTHTVRTQLAGEQGPFTSGERETIVFQRIDGRWLGVHEHLSPDPTFLGA